MSLDFSYLSSEFVAFFVVLFAILYFIAIFKKPKIKQTKYKSDSGDMVKSRAELIISNWLFYRGFKFVYEQKVRAKQRVISDFYLVDYDVYIEFWGLNTTSYIKRKNQKIKIYKQNNLKLIQLDDDSLRDLNLSFETEFNRLNLKNLQKSLKTKF